MIDWIADAKNARIYALSHQIKQLKISQFCINFARVTLIIFLLLLGKSFYPYEDADSWGKFDKTAILSKEAFYSELNLEGISDADYAHVQNVWEVFEIKLWWVSQLIFSEWYIGACRCIWKL